MNKPTPQNTQQVYSVKNLWFMKQFYETNQANEKLSSLLRELPWIQFERAMLGNQKLSTLLRELLPNINQTFKDNLPDTVWQINMVSLYLIGCN